MTKIRKLETAFEAAIPKATWVYDDSLSAVVYISGHTVKAAADFGKIDNSKPLGEFMALAHNNMEMLLKAVTLVRQATAFIETPGDLTKEEADQLTIDLGAFCANLECPV